MTHQGLSRDLRELFHLSKTASLGFPNPVRYKCPHTLGTGVTMIRLLALAFALAGPPAFAQKIPPITVMVDKDDDENRACNARHDSMQAAARSALRYNRVEAADDAAAVMGGLVFKLAAAALDTPGGCAVAVQVTLKNWQSLLSKPAQKAVFATVEYCDKTVILTGKSVDMQDRVNTEVKSNVESCLAEWEEIVSR